jgi:hypothetical protein
VGFSFFNCISVAFERKQTVLCFSFLSLSRHVFPIYDFCFHVFFYFPLSLHCLTARFSFIPSFIFVFRRFLLSLSLPLSYFSRFHISHYFSPPRFLLPLSRFFFYSCITTFPHFPLSLPQFIFLSCCFFLFSLSSTVNFYFYCYFYFLLFVFITSSSIFCFSSTRSSMVCSFLS